MKKIVGIDFGTTNVRIAQWNSDDANSPSTSCEIGRTPIRRFWMPAVIAFEKLSDGQVEVKVGEDADILDDEDPNVVVVRNVKRYATASDKNVRDVLKWSLSPKEGDQGGLWPEWMDMGNLAIRAWDGPVSVEEAMKLILQEAVSRAGLAGEAAEWRAGCPVSSDLAYRKALIAALDELGCGGKVKWVSEEPLLLAALGDARGTLAPGSYMVYDLGGGSFDCAVVEIEDGKDENGEDKRWLTVYAQEGLLIGGVDIDRLLIDELGYKGRMYDFRFAKEQLSPGTESVPLGDDGAELTSEAFESVLEESGFFNQTLAAMLAAYGKAKTMWKRAEEDSPYGEYIAPSGWLQKIQSMVNDIDKFLVVGGPTNNPYFVDKLEGILGKGKVVTAANLAQATDEERNDAAITALSHGACYMVDNQYFPVSVDRAPATITLTVTDGHESKQDAYIAFQRMPYRDPLADYKGSWVTLESERPKTYRVLIESADGEVLHDSKQRSMRMPRDGYLGPLADRARLVIGRLGSVWVRLGAGFTNVPQPIENDVVIQRTPEWQTGLQKEVMDKLEEIQRRLEAERQVTILRNVT